MKGLETLKSGRHVDSNLVNLYLDTVIPIYSHIKICRPGFAEFWLQGVPTNVQEDFLRQKYMFIPFLLSEEKIWSLIIAKPDPKNTIWYYF